MQLAGAVLKGGRLHAEEVPGSKMLQTLCGATLALVNVVTVVSGTEGYRSKTNSGKKVNPVKRKDNITAGNYAPHSLSLQCAFCLLLLRVVLLDMSFSRE